MSISPTTGESIFFRLLFLLFLFLPGSTISVHREQGFVLDP